MTRSTSEWLLAAPVTATSAKADTPVFPFLASLIRGEDLSAQEAAGFFRALTDVNIGSNQIAAALTALTAKGETADELAGMASVMSSLATRVKAGKGAIDIAGTGSSLANTFNVSTAAAHVAPVTRVSVATHRTRGRPTHTGRPPPTTRATSITIRSPGLRNTGGFRPMPTPEGVPVAITSPGSRVMACDKKAIN